MVFYIPCLISSVAGEIDAIAESLNMQILKCQAGMDYGNE